MGDGFAIEREADGAFRVRGKRIERTAAQTNFDVEESAERFQRALGKAFGDEYELPPDLVYVGNIGGDGVYGYCTSDQPEPDPTPIPPPTRASLSVICERSLAGSATSRMSWPASWVPSASS